MSQAHVNLYNTLAAYRAVRKKHTYPKLMASFQRSAAHVEAFNCCAPILIIKGGWRSGKTSQALIIAIAHMAGKHPGQLSGEYKMPGIAIRIFSSDFNEGHRGVIQPKLEEYLPDDWKIKYSMGRRFATITPPGVPPSTIQFCTYNQSLTKLGGIPLDIIILDEMPPEDIFDQSKGRVMDRNGRIIVAATPDFGMDWSYYELYVPWEEGKLKGSVEYVTFTTDDNVDVNGGKRIDEAAKARTVKGMTAEQKEAKIDGKYVAMAGKVWPTPDESQVIDFEVPVGMWTHFWCMDYHARTPCHALTIGMDSENHIWVYDAVKYQMTTDAMAQAIMMREGGRRILQRLIDVTAAMPERGGDAIETAIEKLTRAGLNPLDSVAKKDTMMSISLVRDLLAENRITFHKTNCRELLQQMKHLQWEDEYNKRKLTSPRDRIRHYASHFCDCLRYLIMFDPYWRGDCVS